MKYFELCDKAYLLASELMEEDCFLKLMECKKKIENNYQKEISDFKYWEAQYLEAKQYGTYHPDYQKVKEKFMQAKNVLFGLDIVKKYKELERSFQNRLNEVSAIIKESIKQGEVK